MSDQEHKEAPPSPITTPEASGDDQQPQVRLVPAETFPRWKDGKDKRSGPPRVWKPSTSASSCFLVFTLLFRPHSARAAAMASNLCTRLRRWNS